VVGLSVVDVCAPSDTASAPMRNTDFGLIGHQYAIFDSLAPRL
jgi:hypothetical protein